MKKVLFIVLISLTLAAPFKVNSLDLKLTYKEDLKECYYLIYPVLPSYDNAGAVDGYFFFAHDYDENIYVMKMDLNNKIVWKKTEEIFDDNLSVNGDGDNTLEKLSIIKYDDNHNVVFETQWGGNGHEWLELCYKSFDNAEKHDGYIMLFRSYSTDLSVEPGYILVKFDLNGNLVWQKNATSQINNGNSNWLPIAHDKDNISYIENNRDGKIIRGIENISSRDKTIVWEKKSAIIIYNLCYSYNKSGVLDGIVAVGVNNNDKGTIIKYDLNGNEVFKSDYDSDVISPYTDVISSRYIDGTYDGYIVTTTLSSGKSLIIKYDYSGKITWKEEFSSNAKIPIFFIKQSYDNLGNPNGYLLHPSMYGNEDDNSETCEYTLFKYTYESYPIEKETSDEGTISVDDKAYPGDTVKVKVTPKDGYSLKRIVVIDESGKKIEVTDDGTFIMPEGKVTVTAIYNKIINPDTTSACYIVLGIILVISISTLIVNKKNRESE